MRERFKHLEFRPECGSEGVGRIALHRQATAPLRPVERERRHYRRATGFECLEEVQPISLPIINRTLVAVAARTYALRQY